jgi:hypothetical protein
MREVTVTVNEDHLGSIEAVAGSLARHGMQVTAIHAALGIISGFAPEDLCPALGHVDGVECVDCALGYELQPPDSPLQ